jgi:hypothetical protein
MQENCFGYGTDGRTSQQQLHAPRKKISFYNANDDKD